MRTIQLFQRRSAEKYCQVLQTLHAVHVRDLATDPVSLIGRLMRTRPASPIGCRSAYLPVHHVIIDPSRTWPSRRTTREYPVRCKGSRAKSISSRYWTRFGRQLWGAPAVRGCGNTAGASVRRDAGLTVSMSIGLSRCRGSAIAMRGFWSWGWRPGRMVRIAREGHLRGMGRGILCIPCCMSWDWRANPWR
jgi:hypothetical protein